MIGKQKAKWATRSQPTAVNYFTAGEGGRVNCDILAMLK